MQDTDLKGHKMEMKKFFRPFLFILERWDGWNFSDFSDNLFRL